jgi:hypothetical protein
MRRASRDVLPAPGLVPQPCQPHHISGSQLAVSPPCALDEAQQACCGCRAAPSRDWEGMVSLQRNSLGQEFFKYLDLRVK